MENKKYGIRRPVPLAVILLILLGLRIAYVRGDIGMPEKAMYEQELEELQEERPLYGAIGDSMAVFLDYREDLTDIDVDIYVKRKYNIGWFFRYGQSGDGPQDYLQKMNCDGNGEYVLLYLSADPVSHIEVDKGNGTTMTINPEQGKPFARVMKRSWNVVVYDEDGGIIRPVERNM